MKATSIKGRTTEEIKTALNESMADGFKPTLAMVFLSIRCNDYVLLYQQAFIIRNNDERRD